MFRIAAVLIALFAVGHTLGFRNVDAGWGIDAVLRGMKTIRFQTQGFTRSYWDFYVGFGLFVTVFLLFAAVVSWYMGGVAGGAGAQVLGWTLTVTFGAVVVLSWRYFFVAPLVFSGVIFVCLLAGTLLAGRVVR